MLRVLDTSLRPSYPNAVLHVPLIEIIPFSADLESVSNYLKQGYTLLCTSQTTVELLFDFLQGQKIAQAIAVGQKTKQALEKVIDGKIYTPSNESQEGVIELIQQEKIDRFVYPHSALARKKLLHFLQTNTESYCVELYTAKPSDAILQLDLNAFDAIYFASTSAVESFAQQVKPVPKHLQFLSIGDITRKAIEKHLRVASE